MKAATLVVAVATLVQCSTSPFLPGDTVSGMWGGSNAGLLADDTSAHIHIGCTYGDVHQPIVLDANRRFDVPGEHNITAYPVDRGILHPARYTGSLDGRTMTLRVMLSDTAVTLGPVSVTYEKEPNMGPCPICFGTRARPARRLTER
jgi:hypothetical protein